ncbi:Serine threonine protein kinase [Mycena kentingensis (nom. inval.)]|nr:Serine threonine protein kinase [Mycena kentingensis (nom. inval.)]
MSADTDVDPFHFPRLVHIPHRRGRKAVSLPDPTQFALVTRALFGVGCRTPTEVYSSGLYNELFRLELDPASSTSQRVPRTVLARVARDTKTRSDNSLESELATMVFVRHHCPAVPVPRVYGYCPTRENAVGLPFAIVEFVDGIDMHGVPWEDLPLELKLVGVRDYARIVAQLAGLSFKSIGSIYFKWAPPTSPPSSAAASSRHTAPAHDLPAPIGFTLGAASWPKHDALLRARAYTRDVGPWKSAAGWLKASLGEEIQFVENVLSGSGNASGKRRCSREADVARRVLPAMRACVPEARDDPGDQCALGPFVLGHMDLSPWNMIYAPKGPSAGHILAVLDWETSLSVPLWRIACYPLWFDVLSSAPQARRDPAEARAFRDAYVRELHRLSGVGVGGNGNGMLLRVVQNAQYEARRRFAEIAALGWEDAEVMECWLERHRGLRAPAG